MRSAHPLPWPWWPSALAPGDTPLAQSGHTDIPNQVLNEKRNHTYSSVLITSGTWVSGPGRSIGLRGQEPRTRLPLRQGVHSSVHPRQLLLRLLPPQGPDSMPVPSCGRPSGTTREPSLSSGSAVPQAGSAVTQGSMRQGQGLRQAGARLRGALAAHARVGAAALRGRVLPPLLPGQLAASPPPPPASRCRIPWGRGDTGGFLCVVTQGLQAPLLRGAWLWPPSPHSVLEPRLLHRAPAVAWVAPRGERAQHCRGLSGLEGGSRDLPRSGGRGGGHLGQAGVRGGPREGVPGNPAPLQAGAGLPPGTHTERPLRRVPEALHVPAARLGGDTEDNPIPPAR